MKHYGLVLALLFIGALFFYEPVYAAPEDGPQLIVEKAHQITEVVVTIIRSISYAVALIAVIILGLKFLTGGVHAMIEAKMAFVALVIALFIIFNGETIIGLILKAVK